MSDTRIAKRLTETTETDTGETAELTVTAKPATVASEKKEAADIKAYIKLVVSNGAQIRRAWARWGRQPTELELRAEVLCGASASNAEVRTRMNELRASDSMVQASQN